jgi:hypothetical protein
MCLNLLAKYMTLLSKNVAQNQLVFIKKIDGEREQNRT